MKRSFDIFESLFEKGKHVIYDTHTRQLVNYYSTRLNCQKFISNKILYHEILYCDNLLHEMWKSYQLEDKRMILH